MVGYEDSIEKAQNWYETQVGNLKQHMEQGDLTLKGLRQYEEMIKKQMIAMDHYETQLNLCGHLGLPLENEVKLWWESLRK